MREVTQAIDPLLQRSSQTEDERARLVDEVAALFGEHSVRLTRLAAAVTFDRSLAEEVVQEAFLGLQRRIGVVDNPVGYLQRSVVNLAVNVLRRRKVATGYLPPVAGIASTPEIDEAWSAVVRLPPRQRAVVALRYWQDMSEAEIAEVLEWPRGTVKSTLHRALRSLREEIQS